MQKSALIFYTGSFCILPECRSAGVLYSLNAERLSSSPCQNDQEASRKHKS